MKSLKNFLNDHPFVRYLKPFVRYLKERRNSVHDDIEQKFYDYETYREMKSPERVRLEMCGLDNRLEGGTGC